MSCVWLLGSASGFFTACGGQVPAYMDVLGGWMVKCLPILHGIILRVGTHKITWSSQSHSASAVKGACGDDGMDDKDGG